MPLACLTDVSTAVFFLIHALASGFWGVKGCLRVVFREVGGEVFEVASMARDSMDADDNGFWGVFFCGPFFIPEPISII